MGRNRKAGRHETFAGIVEEVVTANPEPAGPWIEWNQPISSGEYTDETGARWQLRGGDLPWKRVERLIHDPQVRVLHASGNEVHDVALEHRDRFAATIRPYLDGKRHAAVDDYTDFQVGEFKDDQRRSLLVVEETC